jgi:hypothetical protein
MDLFLLCIYVLPMERLRALAMEMAQIRAARFQCRLMDFWDVDNTHVHGRGAVEAGRLHRTPLALSSSTPKRPGRVGVAFMASEILSKRSRRHGHGGHYELGQHNRRKTVVRYDSEDLGPWIAATAGRERDTRQRNWMWQAML